MMNELDVTPQQIEAAIRQFGSNTGGGFVDQHAREYLIRNIGLTNRLEDLRNVVVVARKGQSILLRQVAGVDFAARPKRGDAGYMGENAVIVGVQKQPTADTVAVTKLIEAQLADIQKTLPAGVKADQIQFRQATFIETSIANVKTVLLEAAVVVAIVLMLFLLNVRATLIALTAIPVSILVTVLVFKYFGLSINTMTLGGLAIAIGELVDDAVVGVENILRRLKENRRLASPALPLRSSRARARKSARASSTRRYHRARVRAAVRPFGHRRAPVHAAGHCLHRFDPGVTGDLDHCDAGARLLLSHQVHERPRGDTVVVRQLKAGNRRLLDWTFAHVRTVMTVIGVGVVLAGSARSCCRERFCRRSTRARSSSTCSTIPAYRWRNPIASARSPSGS